MPYSFDSMHGPGVSGTSAASVPIQQIANNPSAPVSKATGLFAGEMLERANTDTSDYGDAIRDALNNFSSSASGIMDKYVNMMKDITTENNAISRQNAADATAASQAMAREQMAYQLQSDLTAMNWSAAEAQKNRDYQERLANTAHQREVKDLIKAGLNPILSANAGAYTGSGATGQAFSSSGAMGQAAKADTDMAGTSGLGSLISSVMNSATNVESARIYTDAQKYATDMNYAMAKMQTEANLYMNKSNIDANKAINRMNNDYSIQNANIYSAASLGAAGMTAGAMEYSAYQNYLSSIYNSDLEYDAKKYAADQALKGTKFNAQSTERWQTAGQKVSRENAILNAKTQKYQAEKNYEAARYATDYGKMTPHATWNFIKDTLTDIGKKSSEGWSKRFGK